MNISDILAQLGQRNVGGNTAFAGGSPSFREAGRAIPGGPIPSGWGPQTAQPMPLPQPMPQQQGGWGQPSPWGSGGPMHVGVQPPMSMGPREAQPSMMPSMPGREGPGMSFTPPQMPGQVPSWGTPPQMQGAAQPRTLSQIMGGSQQQSPWGSGGPMRSRTGINY